MVAPHASLQPPAEPSAIGHSGAASTKSFPSDSAASRARDALLARLLFAARNLAERQFAVRPRAKHEMRVICVDCGQSFPQVTAHSGCDAAGYVLTILDDLTNLEPLTTEGRTADRDDSFAAAAAEEQPRDLLTHIVEGVDKLFLKYGLVPIGIDPTEGGVE